MKRTIALVLTASLMLCVNSYADEDKIAKEKAKDMLSKYEDVSEKVMQLESSVNKIAEKLNKKYCSIYDVKLGRSVVDIQSELMSYQDALDKLQARKYDMYEEYADALVDMQAKALKVDKSQLTADGFVKPLKDFHVGSGFGMRMHPIKKERLMHYGIDLSTKNGTDKSVYAVTSGIVIYSDMTKGYGNVVMIQHVDNLVTLYAHMDFGSILVKEGDLVNPGQVIGTEGSTGLSTGPHLHFETIVNGVRVNPKTVIDF